MLLKIGTFCLLFVEPFFLFLVLPCALLAFYGAGRKFGPDAALGVLVIVSVIFYAPYGLVPALLLITSLVTNLVMGLSLACGPEVPQHGTAVSGRKALLWAGLAFNFLALAAFKYFGNTLAEAFPALSPALGVAIPAGISFYTFHQAVFLVDAYNRHPDLVAFFRQADHRISAGFASIRYSAFVAFFPQLVIGPITFMREFGPQVLGAGFARLSLVNLKVGISLVVIGLFKKICLADPLAEAVNPVFTLLDADSPISPSQAVYALIGFYFQLYFDFSGYSDIALGIGRMFGIRLPLNFDSPLRATGIVDFYRRWHITLTRVIALFLFTPLSLWGTRFALDKGLKGWKRRALTSWLPFMVNFQVIALWHAAKGTFVVFGLVHGIWYVLESEVRTSKRFKALRNTTSERARFLAGLAFTALPLMLTFALFRSESLATFAALLKGFVAIDVVQPDAAIKMKHWNLLLVAAGIIYCLPNAYEWLRRYRPGIVTFLNEASGLSWLRFAFRPNLINALFILTLWGLVFARLNKPSPFLYAGF